MQAFTTTRYSQVLKLALPRKLLSEENSFRNTSWAMSLAVSWLPPVKFRAMEYTESLCDSYNKRKASRSPFCEASTKLYSRVTGRTAVELTCFRRTPEHFSSPIFVWNRRNINGRNSRAGSSNITQPTTLK